MLKLVFPLVFVVMADGAVTPPPLGSDKDTPAQTAAPAKTGETPGEAEAEAAGEGAEAGSEGRRGKRARSRKRTPNIKRSSTPPPSIRAPAFREELGLVGKAPKEGLSEREQLEALSLDLARAREALRAETARLEQMLKDVEAKKVEGGDKTPPQARPGSGAESGTMPIGSPLAALNAFSAEPPPSFGTQVMVVSKAMKGMKPEKAAAIMAHLDRTLAAEVLQRMRPADAGAILGFLRPEVGALLASEIVNRPPVGAGKNGKKGKANP